MVESKQADRKQPKKRISLFLRLKGVLPYLGFILAILILISQQTIWKYYEEIAGRLIIDLVRYETRGEFDISYDDVRFNLFTDHLVITDFDIVKLRQPQLGDTVENEFELSSHGVSLTVNSILDVILTQEIEITGINIIRPRLFIQSDRRVEIDESKKLATGELLEIIKGYLRDLKLEQLTIRNASVEYRRLTPENEIGIKLDSITLSIDQFEILNPLDPDQQTFLTSDIQFEILSDSISSIIPGHLITFERVAGSSFDSLLHLENIKIHPFEASNTQSEYHIDFPELTITDLDFTEAVKNQGLLSGHLLLNDGNVDVVSKGKMTERRNLNGIPLRFDSVSILNSQISLRNDTSDSFGILIHSFDLKSDAIDLQSFDPNDIKSLIDTVNLNLSTSHLEFPIKDISHVISVDTVFIDFHSELVMALGISSNPISKNLNNNIASSIASFEADQLDFHHLLFDRELLAERLVFRSSNLAITSSNEMQTDSSTQNIVVDSLIVQVNSLFDKVEIDQLAIINLGIDFNQTKQKSRFTINRIDLNLNDILIDSSTIYDKTRIAGIKAIAIEGKDLEIDNESTTTSIRSNSFSIQPNPNQINFDNLTLTTSYPNNRSFGIGNLKMVGIDWYALSHLQLLQMDSLLITRPDVSFSKLDTVYIPSDSLVISSSRGVLDSLLINHLSLTQGHLDIQNYNDVRLLMGETEIRADDFKLLRTEDRVEWTSSFFYAENGPFSIILNPINHLVEGQGFTLSKVDSMLRLNQLKIGPLITDQESNQLEVLIPNALMTGVNLSEALEKNLVQARSLKFINPKASIDLTKQDWQSVENEDLITLPNTQTDKMTFSLERLEFINTSLNAQFRINDQIHKSEVDNLDLSIHDLELGPQTVIDSALRFLSHIEIGNGRATYSGLPQMDSISIGSIRWHSTEFIQLEDLFLSGVGDRMRFRSSFPVVQMTGSDWLRRSLAQEYSYDTLLLEIPDLTLTMDSTLQTNRALNGLSVPTIQFSKLMLDSGKLEYNNYDQKLVIPAFDGALVGFNTSLGLNEFMSNDFRLSIFGFRDILSGDGGNLHASEIQLSTANRLLEVKGLDFEPSYSKYEYGKIIGRQTDWIDFKTSTIEFTEFDFWTLLDQNELRLGSMKISDADLDLYRDKNIPFPHDQVRYMPQDYINSIPIPVTVDSILISNLNVRYEELSPDAPRSGSLIFSNIDGTIRNITNDSNMLVKNHLMTVDANALLMDAGQLRTSMEFDLINEDQAYSVSGSLSEMNLSVLNKNLEYNWNVQITGGRLNKMDMYAQGDTHYSLGEMEFLYEGLHLNLIGKKRGTTSAFGPSLGSFFANTFIVNKRNPKLIVPRKGDIYAERDTTRAFFNYLAKTTLSGVVSSIGARNNRKDIKRANKEAKDRAERKKKRRKEERNKSGTVSRND